MTSPAALAFDTAKVRHDALVTAAAEAWAALVAAGDALVAHEAAP